MAIEPFRFLHTGDLHLDSPFTGLRSQAPAPIAESLRRATVEAWRNVVRLALDERVDFVVVAGDVFEHATRSLLGQTRFRDGLADLAGAGIASYVVHGNHDPLDERAWSATLEFPELSHRFGTRLEAKPVVRDGREIARVYGQSFGRSEVRENLAAGFRREADAPFAVGLLHANVGDRPGHGNYAPCSVDDLRTSGMDYWALGHIHRGGVVSAADPLAVYCGNPQGRDPGESGPRGAWLVSVDAAARPTARFVACDVIRWEHVRVPCAGLASDEALRATAADACMAAAEAADGRSLVVRLHLEGRTALHAHLARAGYRAELHELLGEQLPREPPFVWLESIVDDTRPEIDLAARRAQADFAGDYLRVVDAARRAADSPDPELNERWTATLEGAVAPLYDAPRARRLLAGQRPDAAELFGDLLDEAELLGIDLLFAEEPR